MNQILVSTRPIIWVLAFLFSYSMPAVLSDELFFQIISCLCVLHCYENAVISRKLILSGEQLARKCLFTLTVVYLH